LRSQSQTQQERETETTCHSWTKSKQTSPSMGVFPRDVQQDRSLFIISERADENSVVLRAKSTFSFTALALICFCCIVRIGLSVCVQCLLSSLVNQENDTRNRGEYPRTGCSFPLSLLDTLALSESVSPCLPVKQNQ
jgi:hypothetical protein